MCKSTNKFEEGKGMTIAEKVKRIIKDEGFTQIAIARKIGMNPNMLNAKLNGRALLFSEEIPPLCVALGVTPNQIFDYAYQRPSSTKDNKQLM